MESKNLKKYLEDYYRYLRVKKNLADKTISDYRQKLRRFTNWFSKNYPDLTIEDLTIILVDNFQIYLDDKHISKGTQYHYLIALRGFLLYLRVIGIKSLDPLSIEIHQEKTRQRKYLDESERDRLFKAIDTTNIYGLRDRAMIELLYSSGLRLSEICTLNIDDIKREEKQIKGRAGKNRLFFISPKANFWIDKYLEKRTDSEKALFISYTNVPVKDKRLSISTIGRLVKHYGEIAEIPFEVTPMTLRHSFANELLKNGASLKVVQDLLGHSSLATTEKYTSTTNKELSQTYKRIFKEDEYLNLKSEKNQNSKKRIIDQSIIDSIPNNKLKKICNEINTTPDENVLSLSQSIGEGLKWAVWIKAKQKNTKLTVSTGLKALLDEAVNNNYFKSNAAARFLKEFKDNFMKTAFDMVRHDEEYVPDIQVLNPQIDALEYILKELEPSEK